MKTKRVNTNKKLYLLNMILFIGFAFEFFIRGDDFLGLVLLFNGVINLLAYQQVPNKVASITVILNLFNALISTTVSINYQNINFEWLFYNWMIFAIAYFIAVIMQTISLIKHKRLRSKHRKKRR